MSLSKAVIQNNYTVSICYMQKFPWVQYASSLAFYLLIVAGIVVAVNFLPDKKIDQPITAEQVEQLAQQQEVEKTKVIYQRVLTAVGRLIALPEALPQISVVQDRAAFVQQNPVFSNASAGDIVLLYADRVIIYSPQYDRVVHSEMITPVSGSAAGQQAIPQSTTVDGVQ